DGRREMEPAAFALLPGLEPGLWRDLQCGAAECRRQRLCGNRACHGPRARVRVPYFGRARTRLRDRDRRERGRPHLRGARSGAVLGCGAEARATALRRAGTQISLRTPYRSANRLRYFRISSVIRFSLEPPPIQSE